MLSLITGSKIFATDDVKLIELLVYYYLVSDDFQKLVVFSIHQVKLMIQVI